MNRSGFTFILLWVSRFLFGIVFIFSGFVKAIDPLGSTYKFQDYFIAFGMEWLFPVALPLSVFMSGLEFLVGVTVLLGLKMRWSAWAGLLFMAFFTPLTLYIAIFEPVTDCGCFGDALVISNWATFYKNIFILAAAIFIFIHKNKVRALWSEKRDWILVGIVAVFIVWVSVYCLRNLPIIDFRPWKIGNNIFEMKQPRQEEIAEFFFVYRNSNTGEQREFAINDLPSADEGWEYVDRRDKIIQEFIEPRINDFFMNDEFGFDMTETYLGNPDYQFVLVVYNVNRTNRRAFTRRINQFVADAEADGVSFIGLTGSSLHDTDIFRHDVQAAFPFYQSGEVQLKTIIRSNPGLLLMKDWVVIHKWHHRNIPDYEEVKERFMTSREK